MFSRPGDVAVSNALHCQARSIRKQFVEIGAGTVEATEPECASLKLMKGARNARKLVQIFGFFGPYFVCIT